jgi:hypothetical protein
MRTKFVRGFKTGDMVRTEVPKGEQAGIHVGRVAVRASGPFRVGNADGQTPNTANFSIARTAMAMPGGPRFLPRLKPGVSSAGGSDENLLPLALTLALADRSNAPSGALSRRVAEHHIAVRYPEFDSVKYLPFGSRPRTNREVG